MGRLAIGRVANGSARSRDPLVRLGEGDAATPLKVVNLQTYHGIGFREVAEASAGDIVLLAGIEDVSIGDTICTREAPKALRRIQVDEPTVAMRFCVNTSPLAGREGRYVQARRIEERLRKEMLHNVGLRMEGAPDSDAFVVKGRGEFQLAILIETMRREGFEVAVGRPQVIFKERNGRRLEPIEHLLVDCGEDFVGIVTDKLFHAQGKDG